MFLPSWPATNAEHVVATTTLPGRLPAHLRPGTGKAGKNRQAVRSRSTVIHAQVRAIWRSWDHREGHRRSGSSGQASPTARLIRRLQIDARPKPVPDLVRGARGAHLVGRMGAAWGSPPSRTKTSLKLTRWGCGTPPCSCSAPVRPARQERLAACSKWRWPSLPGSARSSAATGPMAPRRRALHFATCPQVTRRKTSRHRHRADSAANRGDLVSVDARKSPGGILSETHEEQGTRIVMLAAPSFASMFVRPRSVKSNSKVSRPPRA